MAVAVSGKELVDWTENDFPGRTAGTRAAHTVGIGVAGIFTPSEVIANYCTAPQFNSGPTEIVGRFSNGSGLDTERDLHTDARGLAVKFFRGEEHETDLVAMTLPVFFVSTGEAFEGFSKASIPVPVAELRTTWWERVKLALQLRVPDAAPPDDVATAINPAHLADYAKNHPEAKTGVAALAGLITPISYARAAYHGVHTFMMTDPGGRVRPVRYQWEPFLGVRGVTAEQRKTLASDHLHTDLRRRLEHGTLSFTLNLSIGDDGDPIDDPTQLWQMQRRRVSAGVLTLTRVEANQIEDCERLSFNPGRLVEGFTASNDDLLASRIRAYEYSCSQRSGEGCPVMHTTVDLRGDIDLSAGAESEANL